MSFFVSPTSASVLYSGAAASGALGFSAPSGHRYRLTYHVTPANMALSSGLQLTDGAGNDIYADRLDGDSNNSVRLLSFSGGGLYANMQNSVGNNWLGKLPLTSSGVLYDFSVEWGFGQVTLIGYPPAYENATHDPNMGAVSLAFANAAGDAYGAVTVERRNNVNAVVYFGDSIYFTSHPHIEAALSGHNVVVYNRGVGGRTVADGVSAVSSEVSAYYQSQAGSNTVVIGLGTNSLASGVSAAAALTDYESIVAAIKTAHPATKIAASTVLKRTNFFSGGVDSASFEVQRLLFNAGLLDVTGVDILVNTADIPQFQDTMDATWFGDQLHPTDPLGSTLFANFIAQALIGAAASPMPIGSSGLSGGTQLGADGLYTS